MASKTPGKLTVLAAVIAIASGMAGCSGDTRTGTVGSATDPAQNHPLTAKPKEAVLVLDNISAQRIANDPNLASRIGAFTYDFVNRGSSAMQILVGAGDVEEAAAKEIAREAVRVLVGQGVPTSRMTIRVMSGNNNVKPGTVVMRYTQWVAVAPECPGPTTNLTVDYSNTVSQNLGCTIQRNVAAMIADPRDLVQPSALEPRYGDPGEAVMRKFRRGEETKTFTPVDLSSGG